MESRVAPIAAAGSMNSAATAQPFALACTARIQEVLYARGFARRLAAPEASAKTGALRRGVSKAGDATRAVPTRTLEKRPQGPNTAGAVAWDPVVCRRGTGPCASAWRKLRSVVCREAHTAAQGAPKLARKLVISGIQRAVDAFTTGSITLH